MRADKPRSCAVGLSLLTLGIPLIAQVRHTMFPPVRGTREMVGAANNLEVEAGFRILTQGGNAVDAGVATVLAAAGTEQARFGLGGEMRLLGDRGRQHRRQIGRAHGLTPVTVRSRMPSSACKQK